MEKKIEIKNRKASFEFHLMDRFSAGLVLQGTEIKSIRHGKASVAEAYCQFVGSELFVKNMHIAEYEYGTYNNHDPRRDRKLLLSKRELRKLQNHSRDVGITIVPLRLFINEGGLAKLDIAMARGKKAYDKREAIKEKDNRRDMERSGF